MAYKTYEHKTSDRAPKRAIDIPFALVAEARYVIATRGERERYASERHDA
ncbi:MAG: hypothetical protein M5R41_14470 [Bacteroidia bacterium]|nr:hypothetical protein [Bacteroidia bacterium]